MYMHSFPFQASKIPPIYGRLTASNISVEEGGVPNVSKMSEMNPSCSRKAGHRKRTDFEKKMQFQVSKSCTRQQLPLSVTRGVRSRPLGEDSTTSTKMDTVPLLSPTMESELLKEPWIFPRIRANPKEEDTFCAWEEDFQDLSSWCMDTFQGHFHIGESTTFKQSGTRAKG